MICYNPLLCLDFYKTCHADQYPAGLTKIVSYYTPRMSRLADTDKITMFGLQAFIQQYLIMAFRNCFFNWPIDMVIHDYKRVLRFRFVLSQREHEPMSKSRRLRFPIHTLTSYGWSTVLKPCYPALCGTPRYLPRLATDTVKS